MSNRKQIHSESASGRTISLNTELAQDLVARQGAKGPTRLGLRANYVWNTQPRTFLFTLAKYKFVAKMLSGRDKVLDVGCGDAFGCRIVQQEVGSLWAIDIDPVMVQDIRERMEDDWRFECFLHDVLSGPVPGGPFASAYALDVLEHIPKAEEDRFMTNILLSLDNDGILIIGVPSPQSQAYSNEIAKTGHVNIKSHEELKSLMLTYFCNVLIFSMNDEVVHTGFYPLAHYLFALGVGRMR